ncbi:MAG TPA: integrase arm-type DNA-binding domain-containing protein, partial [Caulobacteraceae bacterium]
MALTDTAIRTAKPTAKERKLADGGGLYLLVTTKGAKLWRLKFRHAGKEMKLSFGAYPEVSLKTARAKRDSARELVAQGKNPAQEKRREEARARLSAAATFDAVATEYIAKRHREGLAPATLATYRHFQRLLAPSIGAHPISQIEPFELLAALQKIERRGKLETASRSREFAGRVFRYAVATTRANGDVAADLRGALQAPTVKGFAAILEPKRVGELLRAIDGYDGQPSTMLAMKLAPLVFQRPGEVTGLRWDELDLGAAVWRLPEGRKKERREHHVPLSRQAVAILRGASEISPGGPFVFPGARTVDRPITTATLNAGLRRLGYAGEDHVTHGWRKTASTLLNQSNQ